MSTLIETFIAGVIVWGLSGAIAMFALSRKRRVPLVPDEDMRYVFVIPALNEGRVIAPTVRHLLELGPSRVVVVDDASDDDTVEQLETIADPRVTTLRRYLPKAQTGKGAALNDAYTFIRRGLRVADPAKLAICVMDADGRLTDGTLREASCAFNDPKVGACQVSVRIRNRGASFWARMQHFEFVAFTAVYQRGREKTSAVGLGGNGQFVRLSALMTFGDAPWSRCLTEDQDLGIRLLLAGFRTRYLASSWVSQQALPDVRRLLRQRTRWFQGTLQCLRHVPRIVGSTTLPLKAKLDLAGALMAPPLLLAASPLMLAGWGWLAWAAVTGEVIHGLSGTSAILSYCLAFLPALLLSYTFWLDEDDVTLPEAIVAGHLFVLYGYLWLIAGWRAVGRQITGKRTWTKTPRVIETPASVGVAA